MNQQLAVAASMTDAPGSAEGEDRVFSGTLVTQGTAQGRVVATGERSALGRIGKSLAGLGGENTPIQNETREVVKRVAIVGLLLAASLAIAYWASTGDWLHGLLAGLTLAMAVLPEELPVVLTLFLGLGAWRLAREKVLARSIPAVELLGATTVLCVDKTGTLTANRMAVRRLWTDADAYDSAKAGSGPLQEALHGILEFAVLASHRRAFDPKETAIGEAGRRLLAGTEHLHGDWTLVDDYPLSREMLAMSRVWQSPDRKAQMIAAKGAPEAIVDLCHMDATRQAAIAAQVATMAGDDLRVLGVARATFATGELPDKQHDFDFEFLGLIALEDPVRPDVPRAITECRAAGIRVVMITGDHPATAMLIARQAGLTAVARAMTFSVLVMSNLGLIFANRFWNQSALLARGGSNHAFIWTAVATVAVLGAILGIPVLSGLFSHATPSLAMLLAGLGAAALSLLWFEGVQWGLGRRAAQAELQRRPTNDGAKSM